MTNLHSDSRDFEILEAVPDALLIADAAGNIAYVNTQFQSLFGFSSEEVLGASLDKLMPDRFRMAHPAHIVEYIKNPYVRPMGDCSGFYAQHNTGHEFPVEINLSPFCIGDDIFVIAAIRDISRRIQLEEELRCSHAELEERVKARTAELEEIALRLKTEIREHASSEERIRQLQAELSHTLRLSTIGEMSSGLGHELSQPLAAINNYAQGSILRIQGNMADDKDLIDALQRISREATRASEIIARFRRFAKKDDLQLNWVNIDTLVWEAMRLSDLDCEKHGIEVDLHISGVIPQVFIDPLQIQQVIVNLVRNAIDATLEIADGEKLVSVSVSSPQSNHIKVTVTDNGHGLLADSVDHLFQPFFTTKASGLGMGLPLCHRIVEAHGGELSARPNEYGGMTFYFFLPIGNTVSHVS